MKHQLIELLKKANEGASATPAMLKQLIQQYQVAHIVYLIAGLLCIFIAVGILIWVLKQHSLKKDWTLNYVSNLDIQSAKEKTIVAGYSGLYQNIIADLIIFIVFFVMLVIISIGPSLAPAWYMIKDLTN